MSRDLLRPPHGISVIIAAGNAVDTLAESLASVRAQTCPAGETIVVDDGSTDGTARILAAQGGSVRSFRQENRGPAAARNRGLAAATGDVVAFLDADDLWPPTTLQLLSAALADGPELAAAQGLVQDLWPPAHADGCAQEAPRRGFNIGAAAFRRQPLMAIGGFDESLRRGEDVELWVRLRERGLAWRELDAVTLLYRRKPRGAADTAGAFHRGLLRTVKRSLDRQRGGAA